MLLMIVLLGFVLLTTRITLTPSQQVLYAHWESSSILRQIQPPAAQGGGGGGGDPYYNINNPTSFSDTSPSSSSSQSYRNRQQQQQYQNQNDITFHPDIIIRWHDWQAMQRIVNSIWGGSLFCDTIQQSIEKYYNETKNNYTHTMNKDNDLSSHHPLRQPPKQQQQQQHTIPIPHIYVHCEFSCYDLYKYSRHGTGNYIQAIYYMRLAIKYFPNVQIKLNITCLENNIPEFYTNYVLPWFTGVWYTPQTTLYDRTIDRLRIVLHSQRIRSYIKAEQYTYYCGRFKVNPTGILYKEMQYDVRRMVIGLIGTQPFMYDSNDLQKKRRQPIMNEMNKFLNDHIYESTTLLPQQQNIVTTSISSSNNNNNNNNDIVKYQKKNVTFQPGTTKFEKINPKTTNIIPLISLQQPSSSSSDTNNHNIVFDDAVIHFRCGDLLSTDLGSYGFLTFNGYSRHISSDVVVQSIGILTQPFGSNSNHNKSNIDPTIVTEGELPPLSTLITDQERKLDTSDEIISRRCRILVYAFQEHLQQKFPYAKVHIRNDPTETIALAYVRMVMAKQVVGSMSTFSIYPIIGSFGTGYYLRPKKNDPSVWANSDIYPLSKIWGLRTVIFDEKNQFLGSRTKDLWDAYGANVVLQWFRTGKYTIPANSTNESK